MHTQLRMLTGILPLLEGELLLSEKLLERQKILLIAKVPPL